MTDRMPYALRTPEAFAQLNCQWWRFVETAFSRFRLGYPIALHADKRAAEALEFAVDYRADLVGREQACRDYVGWPTEEQPRD